MKKQFFLLLLCTLLTFSGYSVHAVAQSISSSAPAAVEGLSVNFEGPSLTGTISFTLPTKTYGGSQLTGNVSYDIAITGSVVKSGQAPAGSVVTETVSAPYDYITYFSVTSKNGSGSGPDASISQWVGYGEPKAPQNLKAKYQAGDKSVKLTWDAVTETMSGGYFNPEEDLTYVVVRFPGRDTLTKTLRETTYTDHPSFKENASVYYVVTPLNVRSLGYTAMSENIVASGTFSVPYEEHFDDMSSFETYNVVDVNGDWETWEYDPYRQCAAYHYSDRKADDWLFTPDITMTKGRDYILKLKAKSSLTDKPERLAIAFGKGSEPADYTQMLLEPTLLPAEDSLITCTIKINEDGDYRVGFHALSDANCYYLYIDDITIAAGPAYTSPAKVQNLAVAPDKANPQVAKIDFDLPIYAINGSALSSVSKVVALRGDSLKVDSVINLQPGQHVTLYDHTAPQGQNSYVVVAFNESGEGEKASASAFIGEDAPLEPTDIKLVDNQDGTLLISWTAPSAIGKHGGHVSLDKLRYNIYTADGYVTGDLIAEKIAETQYLIKNVETNGRQKVLYYGVSALTANDNESNVIKSTPVVVGKADVLPYIESFANGHIEHELLWTEQKGLYAFNITTAYASDNDKGSAYYYTDEAGEEGWLNTGKIAVKDARCLTLVFDYYATPNMKLTLNPEISRNGAKANALDAIDFTTLEGEQGWRQAVYDISSFADADYIIVKMHAVANEAMAPVLFDNLRIFEGADNNLSVSMKAPEKMQVSKTGYFPVKVINHGSKVVNNFTIRLLGNGEELLAKEVEAIDAYGTYTAQLAYAPKANSPELLQVRAEVVYDDDTNEADNLSEAADVQVEYNSYETVTLIGTTTGNTVNLSWNKPETNRETILDDFESYEPFTVDHFGEWTCYDGDGAQTYAFDFAKFKHETEPMAFITFDPTRLGIDLANQEHLLAHSGNRYIVSFDAVAGAATHSDDWLISPQLTGEEQTISFFAKGITDDYGQEKFEILYSDATANIEDFHKLGETYSCSAAQWNYYEIQLPAGSTHFAIHVVSNNCFGLMIDDVKFDVPLLPEGYNVYRNNRLIATVGSNTNSYVDVAQEDGNYDYAVSVVYNRGESQLSNSYSTTTGIEELHSGKLAVEAGYGFIAISNAEDKPVSVFTTDGRLVAKAEGQHQMRVSVKGPGCYIVKVGHETAKVVVK